MGMDPSTVQLNANLNPDPRGLESLPVCAGAYTGTHARHELSATGNKL